MKDTIMNKRVLVGMLTLVAAAAQAQTPAPRIQLAAPAETRLADIDKKLKALEDKLGAVQAENAELKQQLSQQKTSVKAVDMALTAHVAAYDKHVHFINHAHFAGTDMVMGRNEDAPKVRVILAGPQKDLWTGKPNQPSNAAGPAN